MTRGARVGIALFALLLVNSAYLAAFDTPSLFYFVNVAAHAIGGVLLAGAAAVYLIRFRPRLSALGTGAAVLLACAAGAGPRQCCSPRPPPRPRACSLSARRRPTYGWCRRTSRWLRPVRRWSSRDATPPRDAIQTPDATRRCGPLPQPRCWRSRSWAT